MPNTPVCNKKRPRQVMNSPSEPTHKSVFFKSVPDFDKKEFEDKMADVLELIDKNASPIASQVINAFETGSITLHSFYELEKEHFLEIKKSNPEIKGNFSTKLVTEIESLVLGYFFYDKNKIYITSQLEPNKTARILIHEASHFLTKPLLLADKKVLPLKKAKFLDELRAFQASKLFKKNGSPLSAFDKKHIEKKVKNLYPDLIETKNTCSP